MLASEDTLHKMGLEAPQGNELVLLLRAAGCAISGNSLTEEECVETLYNFITKEQSKKK